MTGITAQLRDEIGRQGVIPFSRFMELALYAPEAGYYERGGRVVGREGDFITSVSVGSLFGELLGHQFALWLESLPTQEVWLVEGGAHDGALAADILGFLSAARPALAERLNYLIVEPAENRQSWQRETLEDFAGQVKWCGSLMELPQPLNGVVFCNELLDAFPVRRLGRDHGRWIELGVTLRDDRFDWEPISIPEAEAARLLEGAGLRVDPELMAVLPEGFIVDISPMAGEWWSTAAGRLTGGRLMAIDYGLEGDEFYAPRRREGTLRGYRKHSLRSDVLADPGAQDLTAHVSFSQLRAAGVAAGLETELFEAQETFLMGIGQKVWADPAVPEWDASRKRQFMTLTHPGQLGRAFRVLVQGRSVRG